VNILTSLASAFTGRPRANTYGPSGYNGATTGRRMVGMGSTTRGVSSLAMADGPMLTARARKAVMDDPLMASCLTGFVAEVIGAGIRPHSKHSDPKIRRMLEKEFFLWTKQSSAARRIGSDGKPDSLQDFFTQQMLVCRNVVEAGEAFARLRPRLAADLSRSGLRVPLQIDLIEPEQLAYWRTSGDMSSPQNIIRASIEFDQIHQRVAYHFYREHPGDSTIWPNAYEIVRVPSQSVLHIMEFIRGSQIRGITPLAPILVAANDLDDFQDATRYRQKLGAYLFAWKKTLTPDDPNLLTSSVVGNDQADAGTSYTESQPGQLTILDSSANEEFGFYAHPGVDATYKDFVMIHQKVIATLNRVTYAMATGDVANANYSSSRIALLALRRIWRQWQKAVMDHQFNRPVWRAWCDAAALVGIIDPSDYQSNPEEYLNVEFLPDPWDWVDPSADVASIRAQVESCFTSREAEVSARGRDVEEVDAEIKRDHDREEALGLFPVYGASRVVIQGEPGDNGDDPGATAPASGGTAASKKTPAQQKEDLNNAGN